MQLVIREAFVVSVGFIYSVSTSFHYLVNGDNSSDRFAGNIDAIK